MTTESEKAGRAKRVPEGPTGQTMSGRERARRLDEVDSHSGRGKV